MSEYLKQQKNDYTQPKSNSKNPDQIRAAQLKALEFQLQKRTLQKFAKDEGDEKQLKSQEEELQMKSGSGGEGSKTEMPEDVKLKMENSFGTDFSDVNIHKDSEQATNIGALAYTQGNDVHFAPGQYEPGSQKGQELLAHELTHVLQQREGRVKPDTEQPAFAKASAGNINSDTTLEKEADEMGAKAAIGESNEMRSSGKTSDAAGKTIQKTNDNETFVVPEGWGLSKIADYLDVTVESLKEANRDKLKTWGDVQGFNARAIISIPRSSSEVQKRKRPVERLNELYMLYKEGKMDVSDLAQAFSFSGNFLLESFLSLKSWGYGVLPRQNDTDKMLNSQRNISTSECWDSHSNDRIAKIHSKVQPLAFKFINILSKKHDIKVRVTQGLRTYDQQNDLYSKGRDDKGNVTDRSKVVTNAKGGDSFHNFGLAIDVVEIENGKALWSNKNWKLIGKVGKECGFEWGGDWSSFVDKPHFQYTMNKPLSELQKLKKSGKWPV